MDQFFTDGAYGSKEHDINARNRQATSIVDGYAARAALHVSKVVDDYDIREPAISFFLDFEQTR